MLTDIIPINEYVEDRFESDGSSGRVFLTYPKYHRHSDGSIHKSDCTIRESSDPDWDWEVTEGIWTLYIKKDGTFQSRFHDHTLTKKPVGVGFYNTDTKTFVTRVEFDLTTWDIEVGHDYITWTNPDNGIIFKVWYIQDQARGIVELPQEVQVELLALRRKNWSRENTYVGVVYDADIDFQDEDIESEDMVIHHHPGWDIWVGGRYATHKKFDQESSPHPSDFERENADEVQKYTWSKRKVYLAGQKKFIEACSLDALESEEGAIVFNTTDTFKQGVDSYSGCGDCYIREYYTNTNYNGLGLIVSGDESGAQRYSSFIRFDLTGLLGIPGTISACELGLYLYSISGRPIVSTRAVLKPWTETGATWYRWNGAAFWATAGALNDDGAYSFNSGNGTGLDTTSSAVSQYLDDDDVGRYIGFSHLYIIPDLQAQWEAGHWEGWKIWGPQNEYDTARFRDSEYGTVAQRPYLFVSWDESSSSSSGSYSCSSSCSSSSSSSHSFSSSSFSSSSFSSSSFSSSSSWSGPFYVREDATGGNIGDADSPDRALTIAEFRAFPAGPGTTMLIKGLFDSHVGQYMPLGPIDWSAKDGSFAAPITIKGYLNAPGDRVRRPYQPNIIVTGSSSSSSFSSSSFSSSSLSSSSSSFSSSSFSSSSFSSSSFSSSSLSSSSFSSFSSSSSSFSSSFSSSSLSSFSSSFSSSSFSNPSFSSSSFSSSSSS